MQGCHFANQEQYNIQAFHFYKYYNSSLLISGLMDIEQIIPEKSPNDSRQYCALELSNKLKVLLIHDSTCEKSACSVSVGVGSLEDPDRSLGLAHFLQHMLFMGSTKYPDHNSYSSFITSNSGYDNAYTSDEQTNYYFQVKNSALSEAVDRLANFFTGALLTETCIKKQTQAVHEQYSLWTSDDNCRKWEILRKLGSPPYSRFTIGNNETLSHPKIRQDLVDFYNKNYSSNIINVVLCSNLTVVEMKEQFLKNFQEIKNKDIEKFKYETHFRPDQMSKLVRMQSIKDETIMQYFWVVQNLRPLYRKHIDDYITHVIGHEGKNSLLSILKSMQYASELSSYHHNLKTQTIVGMQIKLTEEGRQNYEEIYNIVTDYISNLKSEEYIYEQMKEKKNLDFKFKEKTQVSNYVCKLSSRMHDFPLPQILNNGVVFDDYDPQTIGRVLKQLNPFNLIIVYSNSQQIQGHIEEKYLGGKYKVQALPERKKSEIKFNPLLKNEFIPVNTQIIVSPNENPIVPEKIENVNTLENGFYKVCKAGIKCSIHTEEDEEFRQLYSKYLELLLKQLTYNGQVLSVDIEIYSKQKLQFQIFGFNDTVIKLFQSIGKSLWQTHEGQESQKIFQIALNNLIEEYENFYCGDADSIAQQTLKLLLDEGSQSIQKSKELLQSFNYKDIVERARKFWKNAQMQWLAVGNINKKQVVEKIKKFETEVKGEQNQVAIPFKKCMRLENSIQHEIILQSQDISTSCCIVYYQAGQYSQELYYKLTLLKNHIDQPYFNELRTERQLAYYLAAKVINKNNVLGLQFLLVSSTKDPYYISVQIKKFVNDFFGNLDENLKEQKYNTLKESVKTKISTPHNNLKELFDFVDKQYEKKTCYFNRKSKEEIDKYLNVITVNDLKKLSKEIMQKSFDILVVSKGHHEAYKENSENVKHQEFEKIKENSKYYQNI